MRIDRRVKQLEESREQAGSGYLGVFEDGETVCRVSGRDIEPTTCLVSDFKRLYPGGVLIRIIRDGGIGGDNEAA